MVNYILFEREKIITIGAQLHQIKQKLVPGATVLQAGCNISSVESNLAYWLEIVSFLPQNHSLNLRGSLSCNTSAQPYDYPSQPITTPT